MDHYLGECRVEYSDVSTMSTFASDGKIGARRPHLLFISSVWHQTIEGADDLITIPRLFLYFQCCNYTHQTARQIAEFPGFFAGEDGSSACIKCPKGTYQGSQGHADTGWGFLWFLGGLARSFPHVGVHLGRRQASSEKWIATANASIFQQF